MIFLACLAAAIATWLLCFPVIRYLKNRQVLDRPNERSSHVVPTPRGGGLATTGVILAAFIILGITSGQSFPLLLAGCAFLLAGISFIDDLRPIPPAIRFGIHLLAALLLVLGLHYVRDFGVPKVLTPQELGLPAEPARFAPFFFGALCCIYLVGYSNAFNFMDGINGISAMQAFISGVGIATLAYLTNASELQTIAVAGVIVAGAALGFLPHNFPRAKVFMGDVGSVPLGFITAGLGIVFAHKSDPWLLIPAALLHTNYILDTGFTFTRRVLRGEKWYLPHREHFYQRLVRSGKTHTTVTGWEFLLQWLTLNAVIAYLYFPGSMRIAIASVIIAIWLAFFLWAETRFRKTNPQPTTPPVPSSQPG